jgi:hypothetical protein
MLSFLTSRLGIAGVGMVAALSLSATAYINGRMTGWQNYEDAANAAQVKALTDRFDIFEADLVENREEGDFARDQIDAAGQNIERTAREIASLLDRLSCPADPRVSVRVDDATEASAAAIDRAAGRGVDDPPERR